MKKQFAAITLVGMGLAGSLCAQSLYDLAPDDTEKDSLPLTWTVGANIGFDDNPTPFSGQPDDSSFFAQAYLGAAFLTNTPQTTLSVGAQIGVIHYFDNLDVPGVSVDDTSFTASTYVNWTNRISERLRFVSQNNLAYELEPDFSVGFQSQRQNGNFFRWSTDNAIGYRWSERLATYTGVRFSGIVFDELSNSDRTSVTIYNDFRYQINDRTVGTLTYRYTDTQGDGVVSDSSNHFILAGLEHRFSPNTSGTIRAGAQIREVDGGSSSSSPFIEASFRSQVNSQFSLTGYARYGVEDFARSFSDPATGITSVYSDSEALRLGFTANYQVSQVLGLLAGVNYANVGYEDLISGTGPNSFDEDLFNVFVGFNLDLGNNLVFNGRYNFETLDSDIDRDYDRNRFTLGLQKTF